MKTSFKLALSAGILSVLSACTAAPGSVQSANSSPATDSELVELTVIGLNDFHGNLEPIRRPIKLTDNAGETQEVHAAGAAYLADAVKRTRAGAQYSLAIAAGDLIGGSPLVSSYFLDEPAIGAMNRMGLDYNAVGNHEFDRGWRELQRIQNGGCEKLTLREPCAVEKDFSGANFPMLAANVKQADGSTLFPGYAISEIRPDLKVAVIGLTTRDTPTLVTPSGVEGLTFTDEAATINALIPEIEAQGVDAIIVSIHQGLYTEVGYDDKSCGGVSGTLVDILRQVDPRVDLVISGHTHWAYVCDFSAIDPARNFLVTSAGYGGSMLTDITLTIDPAGNRVVGKSADNIVVQSVGKDRDGNSVAPNPAFTQYVADPEMSAYVGQYIAASEEASRRPVGKISGEARDPGPSTEETQLGNLIADAQLFATRDAGAQIAFMNNSGIRTAILPAADGTISYGDIYAVQPFGNTLITKSFTGTQLLALLEQQFANDDFLQTFSPSAGFAMQWDKSRPVGKRVVSVTLNGKPIRPAATYRITMNSFLAAGGDNFTVFNQGTDVVTGPVDLDAIEAYLNTQDVMQLPPLGRVTRVDGK